MGLTFFEQVLIHSQFCLLTKTYKLCDRLVNIKLIIVTQSVELNTRGKPVSNKHVNIHKNNDYSLLSIMTECGTKTTAGTIIHQSIYHTYKHTERGNGRRYLCTNW